ncbi:MAG: transcriptional regulator NrdR [Actinobacteria bacterium]|nr:transcriptional regulator NrdR [Actinomycetota bacterium]MCL6088117.1 transcriptional regulator NrdR [Actinomycetota bacterium]
MKCPFCGNLDSKVIDSRLTEDKESIRRRRECERCSKRFTTYERLETQPIAVIKKDGTRQPFDRNKILGGLIRACIKRNISAEILEKIADDIELEIRNNPSNEISSSDIGNLVLKHLKNLDKVAYIRFASVYKHFDDIKEFTRELEELQNT